MLCPRSLSEPEDLPKQGIIEKSEVALQMRAKSHQVDICQAPATGQQGGEQ